VLRRFPKLIWLSEPDQGQADAINKGFRMAHGEIFGWLNADDFYLPGAVSAAVGALRASGCGLVHGGWRQVDEEGVAIRDVSPVPFDYRLQLESRNAVAQPGAFFTREAFWSVGGVDVRYGYAMDYDLWLKLGARYEVRHVDRILGAYRYHPESKSRAAYGRFWPETHLASRRNGGRYFSPMYLRVLPDRHPWIARAILLRRLIGSGDLRGLGERAGARFGVRRRTG
jgi:glycosyltransferase involved in cell wall biosynthesis